MSRSRLPRIIAAAAVPALLVVAGCSSGSSGSGGGSDDGSGSAAGSSPTAKTSAAAVEPAKYSTLPSPCGTLSSRTISSLVPKVASKAGSEGQNPDLQSHASCAWHGVENIADGAKGSQFHYLVVTLRRFGSDATLGTGNTQAGKQFAVEVAGAQDASGATGTKVAPQQDLGDQATLITYTQKQSGSTYQNATVVTRTQNIVVTVDYEGAGLSGAKTPSASDIGKGALQAAGDAVSIISGQSAGGSGSASGSSSGKAPSGKASSSAKPKTSPSGKASPSTKASSGVGHAPAGPGASPSSSGGGANLGG